jgi:hypothetical protein
LLFERDLTVLKAIISGAFPAFVYIGKTSISRADGISLAFSKAILFIRGWVKGSSHKQLIEKQARS